MDIGKFLFGDDSNKTSYKQAAYDKAYNDISNATYDRMYGGLTDYLDQNYSGGSRKYKMDYLTELNDAANNSIANYKATRNETFGNGIIGAFLNPIAQTLSAGADLGKLIFTGGQQNAWDPSQNYIGASRDVLSDLGALGETALTVGTAGYGKALSNAAKATKAGAATTKQANMLAKALSKTTGKKIASGALIGSGYGATGYMRQAGSENFDPRELALSTLISGGVGGGMAGVGAGVQNLANKATAVRALGDLGNAYKSSTGTTQRLLGNADAAYETAYSPATQWAMDRAANSPLAKTTIGKALQGAGDTISYAKLVGGNKLANSKIGKVATKALSTKVGKIAAVAGGTVALSKILGRNAKDSSGDIDLDKLSDDDWDKIINYYNNGGQ